MLTNNVVYMLKCVWACRQNSRISQHKIPRSPAGRPGLLPGLHQAEGSLLITSAICHLNFVLSHQLRQDKFWDNTNCQNVKNHVQVAISPKPNILTRPWGMWPLRVPHGDIDTLLLQRESFWISTLNTDYRCLNEWYQTISIIAFHLLIVCFSLSNIPPFVVYTVPAF